MSVRPLVDNSRQVGYGTKRNSQGVNPGRL